ncbi:hypothetical protein RRG08_022533 [Elysia crispata]|uniref:Uncharacterized protein n=1 Tax=Elysia crispata TaxID=231223 RepID=A0AAE1D886_9GAST|nr:hypothetical protein RRG08_022533 [Elysia crispata]
MTSAERKSEKKVILEGSQSNNFRCSSSLCRVSRASSIQTAVLRLQKLYGCAPGTARGLEDIEDSISFEKGLASCYQTPDRQLTTLQLLMLMLTQRIR